MFIEELWKEEPDLIIKGLSHVLNCHYTRIVEDERVTGANPKQDGRIALCIKNFYSSDNYSDTVYIHDFDISLGSGKSISKERKHRWIEFMYTCFGDKYMYHLIAYRNKVLDNNIKNLKEAHDNDIMEIFKETGFELGKGQTK